jgi:hypothetical protein
MLDVRRRSRPCRNSFSNGKVANARGLELPTGPLVRANGVIE